LKLVKVTAPFTLAGGWIMYRHGKAELDHIAEVVRSGSWFRYYGGEKHCHAVDELEKKLKSYTGARHVLATSSGTGALISCLAAMGVGPQDEVIVPGYTFIASAAAAIAVGAVPVIAEIDETLTIDVNDIKKKISPRSRVILPVHMLGFPCKMDEITALAGEHDIMVLEDTAQAVGGSYNGRLLGTIGDMGCYSLQWHKIISTGEGGCILTDNDKLYERAAIYHDDAHCFREIESGIPSFPGVNYRMSELAGAVGCAQIDRLPKLIADLRGVKKRFINRLEGTRAFRVAPSHDLEGDAGTTVTLMAPDEKSAETFANKMNRPSVFDTNKTNWHIYYHWDYILEKRSASGTGFPWKMPGWESPVQYSKDMCPATLDILKRSFSFPVNPDATDEEIDELVKRIHGALV